MTFFEQLSGAPVFTWVVLPLLIFSARICDVTLGTLRIIFVARGKKLLAPLLGFCEVSIWLLAISQIMQNLNNIACFFAYAGGFAMGNFVGILIEDKLAMGTLMIRVFLVKDETEMKKRLSEAGFGVTSIDAHGMNGNVEIIYTIIKRRDLAKAGHHRGMPGEGVLLRRGCQIGQAGHLPGTGEAEVLSSSGHAEAPLQEAWEIKKENRLPQNTLSVLRQFVCSGTPGPEKPLDRGMPAGYDVIVTITSYSDLRECIHGQYCV